MTLTPAYGRDYKSKSAAIADLNAGKDFTANSYDGSSGYISIRDLADGSYSIRYKKLTAQAIITVKNHVAS